MNIPTYPNEPSVLLELSLSELRHILESLLNYGNSSVIDLDGADTNARMLDLLLQLEQDIIRQLNEDIEQEMMIREFGEI